MNQHRDQPDDFPFQAIVNRRPQSDADAADERDALEGGDPADVDDDLDDQWTRDAIEEAYQRALEAADIDELNDIEPVDDAAGEDSHEVDVTSVGWNGAGESGNSSDAPFASHRSDSAESEWSPLSRMEDGDIEPADAHTEADFGAAESAVTDFGDQHVEVNENEPDADAMIANETAVSLKQIVEALLFVGGDDLTTKRLSEVLGDVGHEYVDDAIVQLNLEYSEQRRPYEIRMGEGGYRMVLRYEYEKVRHRVFGVGPKEVKLSQESLEMLAFIAYRQPVTKEGLEEAGKKNAASLVRQLALRELVKLERPADGSEPTYQTTTRFLQLFGLNSIHDLPRPEQVEFR